MAPSSNFEEYWSLFVRAHGSAVLRRVRVTATSAAVASGVLGLLTGKRAFILASPAILLVPSWIAHRVLEPEGPSVPLHPFFAAAASLRMWRMALAGTLDAEMERIFQSEPMPPAEDQGPMPEPNMVTDHTLH